MAVAPASILFSINSFNPFTGLSITSPAAILMITSSGNFLIISLPFSYKNNQNPTPILVLLLLFINNSKGIFVMATKQTLFNTSLKGQIENLCQYVQKKLDDSTRELSPKLCDYNTEIELLSWLKQVFMALISSKCNLEELMTSRQETECGQYEQSLQKLELEIRKHIAVEQEMKIHFEELQERLETVEGENKKLGGIVEKMRKKDLKEGRELRERQNKENERITKVYKKKEEDNPKTARGRSSTTMVRDKSRARLREDWEMTENIDLTNHNLIAKLSKKSKNVSKSKTNLR